MKARKKWGQDLGMPDRRSFLPHADLAPLGTLFQLNEHRAVPVIGIEYVGRSTTLGHEFRVHEIAFHLNVSQDPARMTWIGR